MVKIVKIRVYIILYICLTLCFVSCKPKTHLPVVKTNNVTDITQTTATTGGNVTDDGGYDIDYRGVCYGTSQNPTVASRVTHDGTGTGPFISSLTGLTPGTTYYVRAYAMNRLGTGYGNEVSFSSGPMVLPTLTTTDISSVTSSTAVSGGSIISSGGGQITAYGTSTYYGKTVAATPGTVSGTSFTTVTANISGLNSNTLYHYRVKAVNPWCTIYGSDQTFKTAPTSFQDGDGNIYKTVLINNQVWMQDNLKTTKFNDGSAIPNETGSWLSLTTPSYCWYNDNGTYKSIYGGLYNWHAVNTGKLCPTGWHVPTHDEWTALSTFLGGLADAGGHMKEAGISHWNPPNTGADNFSGFTAVPGGYKSSEFANLMTNGYYWSRSSYDDSNAYSRYLDCNSASLGSQYSSKSYGYSVRCVYGN